MFWENLLIGGRNKVHGTLPGMAIQSKMSTAGAMEIQNSVDKQCSFDKNLFFTQENKSNDSNVYPQSLYNTFFIYIKTQ